MVPTQTKCLHPTGPVQNLNTPSPKPEDDIQTRNAVHRCKDSGMKTPEYPKFDSTLSRTCSSGTFRQKWQWMAPRLSESLSSETRAATE